MSETMRLGDIISNGWAGDRNPLKLTMYLRTTAQFIEGANLRGGVTQHYKKDHRCEVVIPRETPDLIARWHDMAKELQQRDQAGGKKEQETP